MVKYYSAFCRRRKNWRSRARWRPLTAVCDMDCAHLGYVHPVGYVCDINMMEMRVGDDGSHRPKEHGRLERGIQRLDDENNAVESVA